MIVPIVALVTLASRASSERDDGPWATRARSTAARLRPPTEPRRQQRSGRATHMYEYATNLTERRKGDREQSPVGSEPERSSTASGSPATSSIDGDTIDAVGVLPAGTGGSAVPGFVDVQVNGFAGVSFTTLRSRRASAWRPRRSLATASRRSSRRSPRLRPTDYAEALAVAAGVVDDPPPGARAVGVHLEGPFLSPHASAALTTPTGCAPRT